MNKLIKKQLLEELERNSKWFRQHLHSYVKTNSFWSFIFSWLKSWWRDQRIENPLDLHRSNLCLSNLLKITTPSALCDNKQNQKFFSAILALALATISVTLVSATAPICPPNQGEDEVILLPNPDDCSSYYACNRGTSFLMKCNEGLEFNAELKVCDWPEKAHCHVSPRPRTEPSSTKSSKFE